MLHSQLTNRIIGCFYEVYNALGYPINIYFDGHPVGEYHADMIVDNKFIVELKEARDLCEAHEAQLINYLKATDRETGFLLNFGEIPEFKRKIFTNDRKTALPLK